MQDATVQDATVQDATVQDATVQDATVQDATVQDSAGAFTLPGIEHCSASNIARQDHPERVKDRKCQGYTTL